MLKAALTSETSVAVLVIISHLGPLVAWSVGETKENGVAVGGGRHKGEVAALTWIKVRVRQGNCYIPRPKTLLP